ncbi:MAG TPA: TMEM43 family protein [Dyella sp.]|uniref:TMEM43 family protein n=1 Tax=Dyella sp. TaxID=1869338 RepID=UPI002BE5D78A|nr:TMEM43 family protein [Dyella sp.]HTV87090.1 TMEM43 family protein [Dyella sp.]
MSGERKAPLSIRELLLPALGAILLLLGVGLVAVTEKGHIDYRTQMKRHGGDVLDLGTNARPDSDEQGYMVRVVGTLETVESPLDRQFNQQANVPVLIRHVQMFQWHEQRYGGPASYEMDWEDKPIDSSQFEHPEGHANPGAFAIQSAQFDAGLLRLDDFTLSASLVHGLIANQPVTPDLRNLPSNLAASFSLYQNALVTSAVPSNPHVGDLRVSWEGVPSQEVTIVAKVQGRELVPASDAADGVGYAVQPGDIPLTDLFPDLPVPLPMGLVWLRRLFSLLLATAGTALLVRWHYQRLDLVLAPSIAVLAIGAVVGVLWLGHDNALAGWWLGLALAGVAVTAWRVRALQSPPQ